MGRHAAMLEFATLLPVLRTRKLAQDERLRTPPVIFASTPDDSLNLCCHIVSVMIFRARLARHGTWPKAQEQVD
jgi:hypothetical protein